MGAQGSSVGGVHVVVVGGGFGGIAASQQLKSRGLNFTLIDMREAFHHNVAALRASVQPGFAQKTFIPYVETFGENFLQGRVEKVDPERQTVVLEGGRELHYSHLILSTGSDGAFPGKFNTVASYQRAVDTYEDFCRQVQAAGSVLVVGGGATGVELAAEIKTEYPEKKVVLVHSKPVLADPQLLPSVRQQVKQVLLEKGVELLLGEQVLDLSSVELNVTHPDTEVRTNRGTRITTDLIISCIGTRVNGSAYRDSLWSLSADGALKVNAHLQVDGFSNIFAVGDCADVNEPKMAYHAGLHAAVAVSNISNSLSGKELVSYRTGPVTMLLSLGRDDGSGQVNGLKLPRFLVALGKSRDLLLWKSWREMGQTPP